MDLEWALTSSYQATSGINPDQVAEANALGSQLQIDPRLVYDDPALMRDAAQQPEWREFVKRAPKTAEYLIDPANMSISRDDAPNLAILEDTYYQSVEKRKWELPKADWAEGHSSELSDRDPYADAPKDLSLFDRALWLLGDAGKETVIGKRISGIGNMVAEGKLSGPEAMTMISDQYKVPEATTWFDKYVARGTVNLAEQLIRPATDPEVLTKALGAATGAGVATAMATTAAGPLAPGLMPFTVGAAATAAGQASYSASVLNQMRIDERGQAVVEYMRQGIPTDRAVLGAEIYSLFATATEATGFGAMVKAAKAMGITGNAFKQAAKGFIGEGLKSPGLTTAIGKLAGLMVAGATEEALTEGVQQGGQDLIGEWQKYLANQQDPSLNLPYKNPGEIISNAAEATATTILPSMVLMGLPFAGNVRRTVKAHNEGLAFAEHHQNINDAVQGSLTKERSPDKLEILLDKFGLQEYGYLSPEGAETLLGTLSEEEGTELASRLGIDYVKTLFDIKEGREVPLKMASLHARFSKEEFSAVLPDLRPAPGEMSQREAISPEASAEVARSVDVLVEENEKFLRDLNGETTTVDPLANVEGAWREAEIPVNGEARPAGEVVDHLSKRTAQLEEVVECLK